MNNVSTCYVANIYEMASTGNRKAKSLPSRLVFSDVHEKRSCTIRELYAMKHTQSSLVPRLLKLPFAFLMWLHIRTLIIITNIGKRSIVLFQAIPSPSNPKPHVTFAPIPSRFDFLTWLHINIGKCPLVILQVILTPSLTLLMYPFPAHFIS